MFTAKDITLYIPCYNANNTIKECLNGIASQTLSPARVIIIDDGSTPPLDISKTTTKVELVRFPNNMGLANARNHALKLCRTSLIASLDSDVIPEAEWLEKLLYALNTENVDGVGGKLTELHNKDLGDRWRAVHMAQHWGDLPLHNPRFLYGVNNLFKVESLRSVGGFNTRLKTNYEDMSTSEKLYANGFNLFYTPDAKCMHLRRDSAETVLRGFWNWHHAKGVINGQFDTPEALISRIENVNFGIFRYRYAIDRENGRDEFLLLDSLIPWVFSILDLALASKIKQLKPPEFPTQTLMDDALTSEQKALLIKITEPLSTSGKQERWHHAYIDKFKQCLAISS